MYARLAGAIAGVVGLFAAESGHAQSWYDGSYIELRGGANFLEDAGNGAGGSAPFIGDTEFDTGFTASAAIGYRLGNPRLFGTGPWNDVRLELEAAYSESDIDNSATNGELSVNNYMFNVYYDIPLAGTPLAGTKWRPFIGGGVGVALIDVDGASLQDDDDAVFAYQIRAGVAYQFTPTIAGTLGYRFFDAQDPEFRSASGAKFDSEVRSHAVEAGLRIDF